MKRGKKPDSVRRAGKLGALGKKSNPGKFIGKFSKGSSTFLGKSAKKGAKLGRQASRRAKLAKIMG